MSFNPINFFFPGVPLPVNKRGDRAQKKIAAIYMKTIATRRKHPKSEEDLGSEADMIWNLMRSEYKDGAPIPHHEIAYMMIGLSMAGQHTSSSIRGWILLRLASRPDLRTTTHVGT